MTDAGIKGRFALTVLDAEGNVKQDTGFFDNMILDSFLTHIQNNTGGNTFFPNNAKTLRVGTGTTAPNAGQTTLVSLLTSVSGGQLGASAYTETGLTTDGTTWSAKATMTFTFGLGQVVGNVGEVGFCLPNVSGNEVHSRALVTDVGGNPTPITVTSADQLIVKYELTLSGLEADNTGTVLLDGITYNWTARRPAPSTNPVGSYLSNSDASTSPVYAASNAVFGSTGIDVTGTSAATTNTHLVGTSIGMRMSSLALLPANGNLSGGIKCIQWGKIAKFDFSPAIPKTSSKNFSLVVSYTLSRLP